MESIISSLQSIPKPSFLRSSNNQSSNRQRTEQKQPPKPDKNEQKKAPKSNTKNVSCNKTVSNNAFEKLSTIRLPPKQQNENESEYKIDLPAISFTDFSQWDLMPYNELFVRERLRRRIERNKKEYAKHGIIAKSVPLKLEIKSIGEILMCGGTLSELRMSRYSKKLSVILSYSVQSARPVTKLISDLNDNELSQIINKYNNLRRTTLINQPCLLCGIYDLYFLHFMIAIIERLNIKTIQSKLMQYLTKSLIYCVIGINGDVLNLNLTRDTTLDLLNYEAIHTLLMCINNNCHICYQCIKKYKLFTRKINKSSHKWFTSLLCMLVSHGFNLDKVIKNASLKHETALMNIYNCEWLDLKQFLIINMMFQPFNNNNGVLSSDYLRKWVQFCDHLLIEYNEMSMKNKEESNRFSLEIRLTIFECLLKTIIESKYLNEMINYLYLKKIDFVTNNDILIMLLFCGHYSGYQYMANKLLNTNKKNIFKIFESFDVLLSITNIISSNILNIGKIIAIRSCLFHYKFTKKYNIKINDKLINKYKFEFIQCLKILFYDYGLYENEKGNNNNKYSRKLPGTDYNNAYNKNEVAYVNMISQGLKTQKKFLMECAFLDIDILRCLMELKLLDESFIVDRFRNTFDFIKYEININVKQIWYTLQHNVFIYNKNIFLFRKMKEKELRLLFRKVIRNVVSKEYRKWISEFIMNGVTQNIDKNMQITKRAQIEDKYKLPNNAIFLIHQYV